MKIDTEIAEMTGAGTEIDIDAREEMMTVRRAASMTCSTTVDDRGRTESHVEEVAVVIESARRAQARHARSASLHPKILTQSTLQSWSARGA